MMGSLNDAFNTKTLGFTEENFQVSKSYFDGNSTLYGTHKKTILLLSNWFYGSNSIQSKIACKIIWILIPIDLRRDICHIE